MEVDYYASIFDFITMLTELSTAAVAGELMIVSSSSRRRSWSDTGSPLLGEKSAGLTSHRSARISYVAVPGKSTERIKINVSGKKYELTYTRLLKFPKSLLAQSRRRAFFYDEDKDELFFDRNRIAFESVYHFYQTAGEFLRPEHIPDEILTREMQFFGLTEYLSKDTTVRRPKQSIRPSNRYQRMLWELFENPGANIVARIVNLLLLLLIILSVILLCIETLPEFSDASMSLVSRNVIPEKGKVNKTLYNKQLHSDHKEANYTSSSKLQKLFIIEAFCVACFTLEVLIRFAASPDKLRFFRNLLNAFDLLAILPFYATILVSTLPTSVQSAYVLRVFRLLRLLRFAKIYRYSFAAQIFVQTIRECISDILTLAFLILMTTIVFASCSYYFEQENKGTNFVSIPAACWWAVVTMSSVGYGDMVPVTTGKLQLFLVSSLH